MYKINMSFLCVLTALCTSQANANGYTYVTPTPTLGDNSLYTITEISKEEYDTSYGNSEVFYDAEVLEKDNIAYHYYKYAQKDGTTSSSSITSGNGGQDVEGGWYAKFGTFDGQAINLRSGYLGNIRGDFVNNAVDGSSGYAGAFYMEGTTIKSVTGDFVNNHIGGYFGNGGGYVGNAYGGAMYIHNGAKITDGITGNFINNYVYGSGYLAGGAIYIEKNTHITSINGKFINNHVIADASRGNPQGGALYVYSATVDKINADFIHNYVKSGTKAAYGGAISRNAHTPFIKGNFIDNYTYSNNIAGGGAIFLTTGPQESVIIGNFIGNYAETTSSNMPVGGAIVARNNLTFKSDGETYFFSNNYTQNSTTKKYNSIFIDHSANTNMLLKFDMTNAGSYVINDSIMGGKFDNGSTNIKNYRYKTLFNSDDGTGVVFLADNIINSDVTLNNIALNLTNYTHNDDVVTYGGFGSDETSRSSVSLNNSTLNLHNNYYDKLNIKNYGSINSVLHVNVGKEGDTWVSDNLNISGNIEGQTDVIVYALSKDDNTNADVMFVTAPNDTKKLSDAFNVSRVYGSPYMWTAVRNHKGETSGSNWYLVGNQQSNKDLILPKALSAPEFVQPEPEAEPVPEPTPNTPSSGVVAPEIVAGIGLQTAGIEQTRSVLNNVSNKVANSRSYCPNCGVVTDAWDGKQLRNGWVSARGEYANIDKPIDMEAKIWAVEGGFDLQSNINNTLGIFASYRKGEYDLPGKLTGYQSDISSKIDINSYLAGLYYRFDKNNNWAFVSVYGGTQQADVKTDDRIANFETDGVEFGASAEIGHTFALTKKTSISPNLSVRYTQINYDNAKDNVGKKYKFDDIKHMEAELNLTATKNFANGKVYVKTGVIQTLTEDDKVVITGLDKVNTYHDQTLGKVEVGGNYNITDKLSAYGWTNYTASSNYNSTSLGLGINFSW